MSTRTASSSIPGFRKPWTQGAAAYFEADTFAAAKEGFKRKRKSVLFHMSNTGEAGQQDCLFCGGKLCEPAKAVTRDMGNGVRSESQGDTKVDKWSSWHYLPASKGIAGGMHYVCSWSNLLGALHATARF